MRRRPILNVSISPVLISSAVFVWPIFRADSMSLTVNSWLFNGSSRLFGFQCIRCEVWPDGVNLYFYEIPTIHRKHWRISADSRGAVCSHARWLSETFCDFLSTCFFDFVESAGAKKPAQGRLITIENQVAFISWADSFSSADYRHNGQPFSLHGNRFLEYSRGYDGISPRPR